jgi:hypothetical protein
MDLSLRRPNACCRTSGRQFAAGETIYSALARTEGGLERFDYGSEAWQGPPENTLAWWRSAYPERESDAQMLAPVDVLLDVLEQLDGLQDEAPLRYLLALELVRRRTLRMVDRPTADRPTEEVLQLTCRRRESEYLVVVATPPPATIAAVQARLTGLLWSGGEA